MLRYMPTCASSAGERPFSGRRSWSRSRFSLPLAAAEAYGEPESGEPERDACDDHGARPRAAHDAAARGAAGLDPRAQPELAHLPACRSLQSRCGRRPGGWPGADGLRQ